jgi:hypothetical protein
MAMMMSELVLEIREMLNEGYPALAIAATLDVSSELVWRVKDAYGYPIQLSDEPQKWETIYAG